jgi:transcriptional regulator with XRE-family HTH domain
MRTTIEHEPLRVWRARMDWTQRQLAAHAGCHVLTVYNVERGQRVSQQTRRVIAEALGVGQADISEFR